MHREALRRGFHLALGPIAEQVGSETALTVRATGGLWRRDPFVWSSDAIVQSRISERLGWLDSPDLPDGDDMQMGFVGLGKMAESHGG